MKKQMERLVDRYIDRYTEEESEKEAILQSLKRLKDLSGTVPPASHAMAM